MAFAKDCGVGPWEFSGEPKIYWFIRWCHVNWVRAGKYERDVEQRERKAKRLGRG